MMHIRIRIAAQAETWSLRISDIVMCMSKIMAQNIFKCNNHLRLAACHRGIRRLRPGPHDHAIEIDMVWSRQHELNNFRDILRQQWLIDAVIYRGGALGVTRKPRQGTFFGFDIGRASCREGVWLWEREEY